jgi:signal transduction histidine kinase
VTDLHPDRIRGLIEAAAGVAGQVDLSALLRSTVETAMELTGARYGALGVLGEHGTLLDFVHVGLSDDDVKAIGHVPRGLGVLGTITREGGTVRVDDVTTHRDAVGFPEHHPPMTSFLGTPVSVGERIFGNLYLTDKPGGFTEQDEMVVELLAVTAGSAVATLRLQERLRRAALFEDRERIARDLHDSIIQDLFAVGLGMQSLMGSVDGDAEVVRARLDDFVDRLDTTISRLRRYIFDLRPPVWARPQLSTELRTLVAELAEPYGMEVGVDVDCPPGVPEAPVIDHLVAVAKEAVSNALRHAEATTIGIRVSCDGDRVVLHVADDGRGFDPDDDHAGFGLDNMARRAATAGGSCSIDSLPGRGTIIRAEFPVR